MSIWGGLQIGLDTLYPARCLGCGDVVDGDYGLCGPCWRDTAFIGGALCDGCGTPLPGNAPDPEETLHCDRCLADPPPWAQGRAALIYGDTGRKLVLALKHGDRQEIAQPAGLWMANAVRDIAPPQSLIIPVPLHWQRMIRRRYNQSALLAKALAGRLQMSWAPDVLQRIRPTPSLDGLDRGQRSAALADAIAVHPRKRHRIAARPVLLVDDVMTSGATLRACTRACKAAGSGPVRVVTLARVDVMALARMGKDT
ncbi:ComF family protein [Sulfitobacter sp. JB4-11]|uniref:ComF family protein n=1 Tax=Sulfitobacter rhodophyticola TaxID=3238304 RepID=UPI0035177986